MRVRFGSLVVHRADCNRQHVCEPWDQRRTRLTRFMRERMRCSVYALQDSTPLQAGEIAADLGWGPGFSDGRGNVILADPELFTGDDAFVLFLDDRSSRAAAWIRAITPEGAVWFGACQLGTGDPQLRETQADWLISGWPVNDDGGLENAVLGIARNSHTQHLNGPRDRFSRAGIREAMPANPTRERSWHGFADPDLDGKLVDGLHYSGPGITAVRSELVSSVGLRATDHSGLVLTFDLTEGGHSAAPQQHLQESSWLAAPSPSRSSSGARTYASRSSG